MRFIKYASGPLAGWVGYVEAQDWTLFVAANGSTYLHQERP